MTVLKAVLGTLAILVIAILLFVYSGLYNIGADDPHNPAVRWLLETTRTRSITARVDEVVVPTGIDSAERVRRGASAYAGMCQACHLAPGIDSTPLHKGLNPRPPKLGAEAARYAPERLFWIVKHGIKMSGKSGTDHVFRYHYQTRSICRSSLFPSHFGRPGSPGRTLLPSAS